MKLLIYARVSTTHQDVDQQVAHVKRWCQQQGHQVVWTIKDTVSGRKPLRERPQFMKIINNEYNFKYDGVVCYNLDRLTRNWDDVTLIEKYFREQQHNIKLLSTADEVNLHTPNGRLMFRIKMAIQCQMPEEMLEKQRIGIERAKREGKFTGRKKGSVNKL